MQREKRRNIKLTVAYEGGGYHGFQRQGTSSVPTIQGALEKAWHQLTEEVIKIVGAGRTDAGVHADGQVVNFRTENNDIPAERVAAAMNTALPWDIRVIHSEQVDYNFHAQYDAVSKRYTYRLLNRPFPIPRHRHDTYFVSRPLDVDAMTLGARLLVGRHDFAAFTRISENTGDTVRTMIACDVTRSGSMNGSIVEISTEADGFLFHMVRTIAGTLLRVGDGTRSVRWFEEVLHAKDRTKAGRTLPGHGLVLERIKYD